MAGRFLRKRKPLTRKRRDSRVQAGTKAPQDSSLPSMIIAVLAEYAEPMTTAALLQALHLAHRQLPVLRKTLIGLHETGKIGKRGKLYSLAAPATTVRATIDLTGKGHAFAMVEGEAKGGKDIFIAPHHLNGASHGDTVLVAVIAVVRGRREGRVVELVRRAFTQLGGIFRGSGGAGGSVSPDDERLPYTVFIRKQDQLSAQDGDAVLVEIIDYGSAGQGPSGRIIEILGDPLSASVQIRLAIIQAGLRETFPPSVQAEVEKLNEVSSCVDDRVDLRHLAHVTIDGETARDFDDAICVEKTTEGFTLYVSIADVSHYVRPGSQVDKEAYLRGTSVYLPDRVLPMLPERLSNHLCSLVPDQDRAAFTAALHYDREGRRTGERYHKSLIRSGKRFTYTTVDQLLYQRDPQCRAEHAALLPMLESASQLAALLKKRRIERGSLEFNIPEPGISLDKDAVASIVLAKRNQAHMLIEDFMLAANEAVAETLARAGRPVLYRIHEYPDPNKLDTFTEAAKALGFNLPRSEVNPAWFAQVIAQAKQSPAEYIINSLLLRTMQQARYSPENVGHFGLAAGYYLHFTSPIRRYPDLVAHRVLQALLRRSAPADADRPLPEAEADLGEAGLHLSQCERKAVDIERNVHARCSALFLKDRIGATFGAIISGVTGFGLYVALDDCYISGAVPVVSMTDDYYLHDAKRYRLIGERSNRIYQLGDRLTVRLEEVNMTSKRITFAIVPPEKEEGAPE